VPQASPPTTSAARPHIPDILDCLAQLSNDEIPTPPALAGEMLDLLPDEVWLKPDYRWLDPGCKSGVFLRETAVRLLEGLAGWEPDFAKRREHIYRQMLWGVSITEMTGMISRRTLYYSRDASGVHCVVPFDTEHGNLPFVPAKHTIKDGRCAVCNAPDDLERGDTRENYAYAFIDGAYPTEEMTDMKFDVIVGNPPYQIDSDGNTRTMPIYHKFVERALAMEPRHALMITPSRWFSGGLGLDEYRARMLLDKHMKKIVDYPGLFECFPGVEIKGGVSYFLWSREHTGECEVVTVRDGVASQAMTRALDEFDIFVRANAAIPVLRKVRAKSEPTLDQQAASRVPFGLQANFRRYELTPFAGSVKIYGNKFIGHTERSQITKNPRWVDEWKALLPKATDGHGRIPAIVTPQPVIAAPGEACTDTYLVIGHAASEEVIKNLSAYLCTKFARFLISLRKVTQDNKPATFAFVPDLPMDRAWTDAELYERYELTVDEVAYVESQIKSIAATTKADE